MNLMEAAKVDDAWWSDRCNRLKSHLERDQTTQQSHKPFIFILIKGGACGLVAHQISMICRACVGTLPSTFPHPAFLSPVGSCTYLLDLQDSAVNVLHVVSSKMFEATRLFINQHKIRPQTVARSALPCHQQCAARMRAPASKCTKIESCVKLSRSCDVKISYTRVLCEWNHCSVVVWRAMEMGG